jgi:putative flippase GtrA
MARLSKFATRLKEDQRARYLAAGAVNTLFGYLSSNALYYSLTPQLHILAIGAVSSVVNITFSFLTYKLYVFRTKGNWLREYLRCYVVYGVGTVIAVLAMWLLVDFLSVPFWLAQALVMAVIIIFSYFGHSRFSFAKK